MGDVKFALRLSWKQPFMGAVIALVLGVGILGNAAMFSFFSGLFLSSLPFAEPERLVDVDEAAPKLGLDFVSVSYPDFVAWRANNRTFDAMAAYRDDSMNLALPEGARRMTVAKVTHDLSAVLGVAPLFGRHIAPEEDLPGAAKVILLVESTWREQFNADPDILGKTVSLDKQRYEVIGVLPETSRFIDNAEAWIPLATSVDEHPGAWYLSAMGRLSPEVSLEQARQDLERIHKSLVETRPANEMTSPVVLPVLERFLSDYRHATTALLFAVGAVLLVACGNVSGLMLARTKRREREFRIRVALGASRYRIVRQLLVESLLFALVGGATGALLGHSALRFAVTRIPREVPHWIHFDLDTRFLAFSIVIIVTTAIVSGLVPARRAVQSGTRPSLRLGVSRRPANPRQRSSSRLLVMGQVAVAMVLLIGSGLLIQSLRSILAVEPGFRPEGLLTYRLSLPGSDYTDAERRFQFFERHLEQVSVLPSVAFAGVVNTAPLGNHEGAFFEAEGRPARAPDMELPVVLARVASADYFQAIGIHLLRGRLPVRDDHAAAVVVVNETFVSTFWPDESVDDIPGKRIRPVPPGGGTSTSPWLNVVGVVADVRHYGLEAKTRPGMYYLYGRRVGEAMTVVVRTSVPPETVIAPVRAALERLDPAIPMYDASTMQDRIRRSLWPRRAATMLSVLFAIYALLLASAGIFGVVSSTVTGGARDIGIRLALGAERRHVLLGVFNHWIAVVLVGLTVGLAGALAAGKILSSFLFGAVANDVGLYLLVTTTVLCLAGVAIWIPARRAARTDIGEVLRTE